MSFRARCLKVLALGLCLCLCLCLSSCGKKLPPPHPVGELSARASARATLITLIVKDRQKAKKVAALHEQLMELAPRFNRVRGEKIANLPEILAAGPESIQSSLGEIRAAEVQTYARYRHLMLELRSLVSEREYKRLMAVR